MRTHLHIQGQESIGDPTFTPTVTLMIQYESTYRITEELSIVSVYRSSKFPSLQFVVYEQNVYY